MAKLQVSRGNCPCLRTDPRELAVGEDGYICRFDEQTCAAADLLDAMPESPEVSAPQPRQDSGPVTLRLSDLSGLFDGDFGDQFLLVAPRNIRSAIRLAADLPVRVDELRWRGPDSRAELIERLAAWRESGLRTSVLWVGEDEFEHLLPAAADRVKLGAISYFSTGFSTSSFRRYLEIIANTDYQAELRVEAALVSHLEGARSLVLRTPALGTSCVFEHQRAMHWFSLHGPLRFGDQTVLPTGELSTLADASGDFDPASRLQVNGEIVFMGSPIVHRGNRMVSLEETLDTYSRLAPMQQLPVIAHVRGGQIEKFSAPSRDSAQLRDAFTGLVEAEPRYRKIHEFGFGTHPGCADRRPGNFHPNERWPGIHIGLGLGGYTPFHIDLALTEVDVFLDSPAGSIPLYRSLGFDRT
jgi:hypothetical protein